MINELSKLILAYTVKDLVAKSPNELLRARLLVEDAHDVFGAFEEFCHEWEVPFKEYYPDHLVSQIIMAYEECWDCDLSFEEFYDNFPEEAQDAILKVVGYAPYGGDPTESENFLQEWEAKSLSPQAYFEPPYAKAAALILYCENMLSEKESE